MNGVLKDVRRLVKRIPLKWNALKIYRKENLSIKLKGRSKDAQRCRPTPVTRNQVICRVEIKYHAFFKDKVLSFFLIELY